MTGDNETESKRLDTTAPLHAAESILRAFGDRMALDTEELRKLFDGDIELMGQCLEFLRMRDEILVTPNPQTVFHRDNLLEAAVGDLRRRGSMAADDIATSLACPVAIICEVLGWLEREGRIRSEVDGDRIRFRVA